MRKANQFQNFTEKCPTRGARCTTNFCGHPPLMPLPTLHLQCPFRIFGHNDAMDANNTYTCTHAQKPRQFQTNVPPQMEKCSCNHETVGFIRPRKSNASAQRRLLNALYSSTMGRIYTNHTRRAQQYIQATITTVDITIHVVMFTSRLIIIRVFSFTRWSLKD